MEGPGAAGPKLGSSTLGPAGLAPKTAPCAAGWAKDGTPGTGGMGGMGAGMGGMGGMAGSAAPGGMAGAGGIPCSRAAPGGTRCGGICSRQAIATGACTARAPGGGICCGAVAPGGSCPQATVGGRRCMEAAAESASDPGAGRGCGAPFAGAVGAVAHRPALSRARGAAAPEGGRSSRGASQGSRRKGGPSACAIMRAFAPGALAPDGGASATCGVLNGAATRVSLRSS